MTYTAREFTAAARVAAARARSAGLRAGGGCLNGQTQPSSTPVMQPGGVSGDGPRGLR